MIAVTSHTAAPRWFLPVPTGAHLFCPELTAGKTAHSWDSSPKLGRGLRLPVPFGGQ